MRRLLILGLITILALGLGVSPTQAQRSLTLDDCIQIALQTRQTIIATRGSEQLAAASSLSALGAALPGVSASYNYSKRRTTDYKQFIGGVQDITAEPEFDATSKSYSASAGIWLFNIPTWVEIFAARNSHRAAKLDVIASELDLIYAVKSAYYGYLAAVENVGVQKEAVKRSEEQLKLIESKFDLGSASLSDVLKQRVRLGNDRIELLRASSLVRTSEAGLAYVIGLDARKEYSFATVGDVASFDGTLEDALAFASENSPVIGAAEQDLSAAGKRVTAAWAEYLPTVDGSLTFSRFDSEDVREIQFRSEGKSRTIGLGVRWNIFDGFLRERGIVSQKVIRNNARAALNDARNLIVQEIKTAYLDVELYKQQKVVSEENVASASEDLKITQEKYNLGAATILDLLESQVSLITAQVQLISADFNLKTSIADLERAMGMR